MFWDHASGISCWVLWKIRENSSPYDNFLTSQLLYQKSKTPKVKTLTIDSLKGLERAVDEFIDATRGKRKFAFYGTMGAGKTTFIKALCKALGAKDVVTSPSFALINEYRSKCDDMYFHFDLYRIKSAEEFYDLGYEEYLYGTDYCFIEWPEKAEMLLPVDTVKVFMEEAGAEKRRVHIDI
jgi:tRNA threonylcarbamoyladenosine biosynthesis protein TsaE